MDSQPRQTTITAAERSCHRQFLDDGADLRQQRQ